MADPVVSYPFDPTGQAVTNRIVGEQIVVLPPGDRMFHFTMPRWAPFYEVGSNLRLRDVNNNVIPLIKGQDYYLSHHFMDASLATMHPIYGSISFLRRDIVGVLLMDYQTLGGVWNIDDQKITEILMNTVKNPRVTTWEQVVDRPIDFPIIDHPWNLDDMVGQKEILAILQQFYDAYLDSLGGESGGGLLAHINDKGNPHQVTAAQAGAYSILQVDNLLTTYLKNTGTAADSIRFAGKTLVQLMSDVTNTTVTNALNSSNAVNASFAGNASNADHLENLSLAQVLAQAALQTAANATRINNLTYAQAKSDILTGKSGDSGKLEGKTLTEIIAQLQQSTGDASTLNGKNLVQIMADVKTTKVDLATRADIATDSEKVGGQTVPQILAQVGAVVPDNAHNAEKVYGYDFGELITNILGSDEWYEGKPNVFDLFEVSQTPVQNPGTGGTAPNTFIYTMVGQFAIPMTGAGNDKFDTTARRISTAFDIYVYAQSQTHRVRVTATIRDDQSIVVENYSDPLLNGLVQVGIRSVNSPITSPDGTVTAKYNQVWMRLAKSLGTRKYGVAMPFRNSFVLDTAESPNIYNETLGSLNTVSWLPVNQIGQIAAVYTAIGQLDTDTQAAFDDVGEHILTIVATPAA